MNTVVLSNCSQDTSAFLHRKWVSAFSVICPQCLLLSLEFGFNLHVFLDAGGIFSLLPSRTGIETLQ